MKKLNRTCWLKMVAFVEDIASDPHSNIRQHESAVAIMAQLQGRERNVIANECLRKAKRRARQQEKKFERAMAFMKHG